MTQLTTRQRQITTLIAEGYSTREIAAKLGVSEHTIDTHRARISDKLNTTNVALLTRYAIRQKWVIP